MAEKQCSTCRYWKPTEMMAYMPDASPHQQRALDRKSEMMRATMALCSWPAANEAAFRFLVETPGWLRRKIGAGELTNETDGVDCPCWESFKAEWPGKAKDQDR